MKLMIVAIVAFFLGLTYNNMASKLFSNEANAKVKKVQDFKVTTTILE